MLNLTQIILNKFNDLLSNKDTMITTAFRHDTPLGRIIYKYNELKNKELKRKRECKKEFRQW